MTPRRTKNISEAAWGLSALLLFLAQAVLGHDLSFDDSSAAVPLALKPLALDVACPLPVDDKQQVWPPQGSSLWTHPPLCEHSTDRTTKYCAYTNSHHGSRGWSIVTTPETAADSVWFLNQHQQRMWNSTSRSVNSRERDASPYKIVDIPGKGKGLVATRPIKQYEEILLDYATVMVDILFTTKVHAFLGYRLLHAAVDRLSDSASVLDLGQSNELAQDTVENILRTNAFSTPLGGVPHIALYPTVSRINHACKPNAYTRFIPESLQISIGAARDIQQGEEITISYITLGQPSADRAKKLQRWGFTCQCSLCTAPRDEIEASDARRREIERLRDGAVAAFQAGRPYQALRLTRQVVGLLAAEELFPLYSEQYENMARIFYVLRDMDNAEKYANMSLRTLADQGYIKRVEREHLDRMWKRFEEEEGGRY